MFHDDLFKHVCGARSNMEAIKVFESLLNDKFWLVKISPSGNKLVPRLAIYVCNEKGSSDRLEYHMPGSRSESYVVKRVMISAIEREHVDGLKDVLTST